MVVEETTMDRDKIPLSANNNIIATSLASYTYWWRCWCEGVFRSPKYPIEKFITAEEQLPTVDLLLFRSVFYPAKHYSRYQPMIKVHTGWNFIRIICSMRFVFPNLHQKLAASSNTVQPAVFSKCAVRIVCVRKAVENQNTELGPGDDVSWEHSRNRKCSPSLSVVVCFWFRNFDMTRGVVVDAEEQACTSTYLVAV